MATPIPENRCVFAADEIIAATGARPFGAVPERIEGVSIDTRKNLHGALFLALRGTRDGHEFLSQAVSAGASAAIVERGRHSDALPSFEVEDTLIALGALARYHLERVRAKQTLPTIAIGGAAGKTTTKELTAALMRSLFGEILATQGNLNNRIGVPMTVLTLTERHRAAVLECGTNQRGEIARLAEIVHPDAALVLNVDIEHTEGLGSLAGVADEEAALFAGARVAIVALAEQMLIERVPRDGTRKVTFGSEAEADVRLTNRSVIAAGRQRITLELPRSMVAAGVSPAIEADLRLLGAVTASNAAAALAATMAAWAEPFGRAQIAAMAQALASVGPVEGRLSTREVGGIVVIDDTYNANPRSVRAALEAARETADGLNTRLIVALGDMLELGAVAAEMHAATIRDVAMAGPDQFIAVGPEMRAAIENLEESRRSSFATKPLIAGDSYEAAAIVRGVVRAGDVLLVKGSRGIAMERVIEGLSV
ncbi:MAG TPA: UDP-N-acetylmuramoyl-tripeptide--D-alanyl-D-alanine ligase [Candidatus Binataceae bacterium]|nr:UDP-N-acetylmuramoyl-tripeptide--D-alanyl-D-alanine ligase [Candidatus Binataceae bacterium]